MCECAAQQDLLTPVLCMQLTSACVSLVFVTEVSLHTHNFRTLSVILLRPEPFDVDRMLRIDALLCTGRRRLTQDVSSPWTRVTVWWICIMTEYLYFATQHNSVVASVMSVSLLSGLSALLPQALPAPSGPSFPWLISERLRIPAAKSPLNNHYKAKKTKNKYKNGPVFGLWMYTMQPESDLIIFHRAFNKLLAVKFAAPFHHQNRKSCYAVKFKSYSSSYFLNNNNSAMIIIIIMSWWLFYVFVLLSKEPFHI